MAVSVTGSFIPKLSCYFYYNQCMALKLITHGRLYKHLFHRTMMIS